MQQRSQSFRIGLRGRHRARRHRVARRERHPVEQELLRHDQRAAGHGRQGVYAAPARGRQRGTRLHRAQRHARAIRTGGTGQQAAGRSMPAQSRHPTPSRTTRRRSPSAPTAATASSMPPSCRPSARPSMRRHRSPERSAVLAPDKTAALQHACSRQHPLNVARYTAGAYASRRHSRGRVQALWTLRRAAPCEHHARAAGAATCCWARTARANLRCCASSPDCCGLRWARSACCDRASRPRLAAASAT